MLFGFDPKTPRRLDPAAERGIGAASNLVLTSRVANSALIITAQPFRQARPIWAAFRHATAAKGEPVWRRSGPLSITVPASATLGTSSSNVPFRIWVLEFDNAGALQLGVIVCSTGSASAVDIRQLHEGELVSTTAISSGATSARTFYTVSDLTSKPYRVLGYLEWSTGLATAGTWSADASIKQLYGPGISLPGRATGRISATLATSEQTTTSSSFSSGSSVGTGIGIVSSITPQSTCNFVKVKGIGVALNGNIALANVILALHRGDTLIGVAQQGPSAGAATGSLSIVSVLEWLDNPATTSATVYSVKFRNGDNTTTMTFPRTTGVTSTGATLVVEEIMG